MQKIKDAIEKEELRKENARLARLGRIAN